MISKLQDTFVEAFVLECGVMHIGRVPLYRGLCFLHFRGRVTKGFLSGQLLGPPLRKVLLFLKLITEIYICTHNYLQSTDQTWNMRVTSTFCDNILHLFHEESNNIFQCLRSKENKVTHLRLIFPLISKRLQTVFSCATYKAKRLFASVRIHKYLWAFFLPNEGEEIRNQVVDVTHTFERSFAQSSFHTYLLHRAESFLRS